MLGKQFSIAAFLASRRAFSLLCLAVGLSVLGSTSILIQELAAQSGGQPNQDPAGTIDGSQTPELISREMAFLMIFRAFTEPANATSQRATIDEERMGAIGHSGDDKAAFKAILSDLLTKIQGLDVKAQVIHAANTTVRSGSHAWNQLGTCKIMYRDIRLPIHNYLKMDLLVATTPPITLCGSINTNPVDRCGRP